QGRLFQGGPLGPGERGPLAAAGRSLTDAARQHGWQRVYGMDWVKAGPSILRLPENYLGPRCYLAELEGAPFVEDGLASPRTRRCHAIVLGILREVGDES